MCHFAGYPPISFQAHTLVLLLRSADSRVLVFEATALFASALRLPAANGQRYM